MPPSLSNVIPVQLSSPIQSSYPSITQSEVYQANTKRAGKTHRQKKFFWVLGFSEGSEVEQETI